MTKVHYLKDYQAVAFSVQQLDLKFNIQDPQVLVTANMQITPLATGVPLVLDGNAKLLAISIDNVALANNAYYIEDEKLIINDVPEQPFNLVVETAIFPQDNKSLMGLYASKGNLYTQCEAEGFRSMTYFFDRPDVMTKYTTTIIADKQQYPVLLSNGNLLEQGDVDEHTHWVKWADPFAKPSYLFALVAGQLACTEDEFVTMSNRNVVIRFYTRKDDQNKVAFAIESLKNAMKWDEERFGLEYDLDIFMVVAVDDFNMGAMENKGLNIFNTKYVLASPQTATDTDYEGIESVIGHEYFHNYTGNRVTCRDWFQLSLKEGLTVFRDQEFSADRASRAVRRIANVNLLRSHQFPEDAGPMAHSVRPESYEEINNFYTLTIYEKGAEVVRMYHTLLGEAGFQKGMKLYFERHDGQAVTCDDFRAAMADANNRDLSQFDLWYSQAGTPIVNVTMQQDLAQKTLTLTVEQHIPDTPNQTAKQPMMIPIKMGLLNSQGESLHFTWENQSQTEVVLLLTEAKQEFVLHDVSHEAILSLLRGFSAPVELNYDYSVTELNTLMAYDVDPFMRWEAAQILYKRAITDNVLALQQQQDLPDHHHLMENIQVLLSNEQDDEFSALMLQLPSESELLVNLAPIDPLIIHQARELLLTAIAKNCETLLSIRLDHSIEQEGQNSQDEAYQATIAGHRTLIYATLSYLCRVKAELLTYLSSNYDKLAVNMTHEMGILKVINHSDSAIRLPLLQRFAEKFKNEALVMDKYFMLVASSHHPDAYQQVLDASQHPLFSMENPNKVRSLYSVFARNIPHFHNLNGSGYQLIADKVIELDAYNPQIAARLAQSFNILLKLDNQHQQLMRKEVERIANITDLSKDSSEIIYKILNQE